MINIKGRLYELWLLGTGQVLHNVREMHAAEYLDPRDIEDLQRKKLEKLLAHAYNHSRYWNKVLGECGVVQDEKIRVEEIVNVTPLTKDVVREQRIDLISDDIEERSWFYNTSGGSTGELARFVQDKVYSDWRHAGGILFDLWTGYHVGQNKFLLWGSERDIDAGSEMFKNRVGKWLRGETWGNALKIDAARMQEFVHSINTVKPVQILAYPEVIYELAKFIKDQGMSIHHPKAIMTSGGMLFDYMREVIEEVFGAPVFNRYGSREVGGIACECEAHHGLHINPITNYVEILRDDGTPCHSGEIGEVVVTSLTNYAMPLIRYRIGDMAAFSDERCSCGRAWPMLSEVAGRVRDIFLTKDGAKIRAGYLTDFLYFRDWIKKFQFIQDDYDKVRLRVAPSVPLEEVYRIIDKETEEITSRVKLVMGPSCDFEIELVDEISPSPSGKYRYTISRLQR